MNNLISNIIYFPNLFWLAAKRFSRDNYTYQASALAFVSLLAIVPIVSVVVYSLTIFVDFSYFLNLINQYVYANFIPSSSDVIQQYLVQFTSQATKLPTISIAFFVVTALMLIMTIEHSLNQIWHVHNEKRHMLSRAFSWLILSLLPFFIGLCSFLSGYIYFLVRFDAVQSFLAIFINLCINSIIFAILYIVVPNKRIAWHEGLLGGSITAILFEFAKKLFVLYIAYFTDYNLIYGSLATIPIFLLWLYFSWSIFLYGAILMQQKYSLEHKLNK